MTTKDERITIRLSSEQRQQIQHLISEGRFRSLSEAIRASLKEFLKTA